MDAALEWTRGELYRPYKSWPKDAQDRLAEIVSRSPWRTTYHIEPPTGMLNDPNGFCYFNGQWHLSYQHFPFGPVHGLKSWRHLTSPDLIHWHDTGTLLEPDSPFDTHGVYSGSAIALTPDKLLLMYTGNVRDQNWQRHSYQNGAILSSDMTLKKLNSPLIQRPFNVSEHFRDPMLFRQNQQLFALIGAQTKATHVGSIYLYRADNPLKHWSPIGMLNIPDNQSGYMVECPNLVYFGKRPLLIFSPQGLNKQSLNYQNCYPTVYMSAEALDLSTGKLSAPTSLHLLDEGFDGYATQAFNTPNGRVLAVSWLNLPETTYPTDVYQYQGTLSLVRELSWHHNKLFQKPASENQKLRQSCKPLTSQHQHLEANHYEFQAHIPAGQQTTIQLFATQAGDRALTLNIDTIHGRLCLDRTTLSWNTETAMNSQRVIQLKPHQPLNLTIFTDISVFECYINKGEHFASGRVFPSSDATWIHLGDSVKAKCWQLQL